MHNILSKPYFSPILTYFRHAMCEIQFTLRSLMKTNRIYIYKM